jgi:alkylated DNA repair dioxygenase AlkB
MTRPQLQTIMAYTRRSERQTTTLEWYNQADEQNEWSEQYNNRHGDTLRTNWMDCPLCGYTTSPECMKYHFQDNHPTPGKEPWWLRLLRALVQ